MEIKKMEVILVAMQEMKKRNQETQKQLQEMKDIMNNFKLIK